MPAPVIIGSEAEEHEEVVDKDASKPVDYKQQILDKVNNRLSSDGSSVKPAEKPTENLVPDDLIKPDGDPGDGGADPVLEIPDDLRVPDVDLAGDEGDDVDEHLADADKLDANKISDDRVKQAMIRYRQEIKSLKEKVGQQVAPVADPNLKAELDALKQENLRMAEVLSRRDLAQSPAFINEFDKPIESLKNRLEGLGKSFGIDDPEFVKIADMPLKDAVRALNTEYPEYRDVMTPILVQIDGVREARGNALADWQKTAPVVQQIENIQYEEKVLQSQAQHFQTALVELAKEGSSLLVPLKENLSDPKVVEYNKNVALLHKQAIDLFRTKDVKSQAKAMVASVQIPLLNTMLKQRGDRIRLLEETMRKHQIAFPKPSAVSASEKPVSGQNGPASSAPKDVVSFIVNKNKK